MDVTNRFSIEDFLAYLFPGCVGTLGLYLLLLLTPLKNSLTFSTANFTIGILLLAWSYVMGLILSGCSLPIIKLIYKICGLDEPRKSIPFPELSQEIINAFKAIFKIDTSTDFQWSTTQFYLCRSLVLQWMPNAAQLIMRQIALRRSRENMVAAVLIWFFVGISWGIWNIINSFTIQGIILITVSTVLSLLIIIALINSLYGNRKREVHRIYTAFLVGYRTGIFR
jgi:hypothetical protein